MILQKKMMQKLWGDNFFDPKNKKWRSEDYDKDGNKIKRAFVLFIMDPINKLAKACIEMDQKVIQKMMGTLKIELDPSEKDL